MKRSFQEGSFGSFKRPTMIVAIILGICGLLGAGCETNHSNTAGSSSNAHTAHNSAPATPAAAMPTPRIPAYVANPRAAQPLPNVLNPAQFTDPVVSKAYRFAQANPELFAQQPCYCYCDDGFGHRSLLDCYASDHSAGCTLCLQEGLLIDRLNKQGKSAEEIREVIVRGEWRNMRLE